MPSPRHDFTCVSSPRAKPRCNSEFRQKYDAPRLGSVDLRVMQSLQRTCRYWSIGASNEIPSAGCSDADVLPSRRVLIWSFSHRASRHPQSHCSGAGTRRSTIKGEVIKPNLSFSLYSPLVHSLHVLPAIVIFHDLFIHRLFYLLHRYIGLNGLYL